MVSVPPPAPHTPQEHPYPITQDSMNCTRKNTSVQPLYSIACKETRGGGMVIHSKTSPIPAFTPQQQRAAPGEYPAPASPQCMGSAHAQAQPSWKKGSVVLRELRGAGGTSQAGAGITWPREQRSAPSPCPRNPDRAAPLPFTAAPPDLWPRDHAETLGRCWERQQAAQEGCEKTSLLAQSRSWGTRS